MPNDFSDIFEHYQDDSWVLTDLDKPDEHIVHCEAVLLAYKMHDIKISPKKSNFFADELKVLGVSVRPKFAELALDELKAKSILSWEKPDSLYTL